MAKKESNEQEKAKQENIKDSVSEDTENSEDIVIIDECEAAKKAAEEFKDLAQRIQAEFDNYRKRNNDSVRISREEGKEDVLTAILPVLDNFERAIGAVDESAKPGVELIYKQLVSLLEKFDVKEIEALNQPFDPNYHHAIAQCYDAEKANTVVEVFQKGYTRKNKVLRASLVKVAQ